MTTSGLAGVLRSFMTSTAFPSSFDANTLRLNADEDPKTGDRLEKLHIGHVPAGNQITLLEGRLPGVSRASRLTREGSSSADCDCGSSLSFDCSGSPTRCTSSSSVKDSVSDPVSRSLPVAVARLKIMNETFRYGRRYPAR